MFIVCGQSKALSYIMDAELDEEITRGLWWFWLSLLGGCAILFLIFSYLFERRLQRQVSKPIRSLSKQIKNPREFMKERSRVTDVYNRKRSIYRKFSRKSISADTSRSVLSFDSADSARGSIISTYSDG